MKPTLALFVGDLHAGSTASPATRRYQRNDIMRHLYAAWQENIRHALKAAKGYRLALMLGGDLVEGFHHTSTEHWGGTQADQRDDAVEMLMPLANRADEMWSVLGTEAHAGAEGQDDRTVAQELGARVIDPSLDRLEFSGRLLDWAHHGAHMGRWPWTRENGMLQLARSAAWESAATRQKPPALVVRHHLHRSPLPVTAMGVTVVICPAWQWLTQYVRRNGYGLPDIGCLAWYPDQDRLERWLYEAPHRPTISAGRPRG